MTYSMHGGAGALISIGMLKKVSLEFMEDCVLGEWSTGAALLAIQFYANRNKTDLAWQDDCLQADAYDQQQLISQHMHKSCTQTIIVA